ncbi:class I adenylate-forming enzyme family protein [Rhodococcus sp. TAF43]|uniref:class I adenylate-forming enzyme family protein n=1 Tax=Rhodococcus sp. TAF43 TaxID=3237483 RepID=UPI003F9DA0A2
MASLLEYPAGRGRLRDDRLVRGTDGLLRYTGLTSSLTELLDVAAHRFGSREAVVEVGGARLTHAQLWTSASRVAGGLLQQGIDIGDRVAIRMPNGARWVQAFLGVLLAGGVPVPIHPGHGVEETRHIMADSGSVLVLDGELPQGVPFIDDGAGPDDSALLFYTGGTTGPPKGVELCHENVLSTIESVIRAWDLDVGAAGAVGGVRHAIALPLSSAAGCVSQLLPTLVVGGTVVLQSHADVGGLLHALDVERVERLSVAAPLYRQMVRAPGREFDAVRFLALDDEPLSTPMLRRLRDRFPAADVASGWAMTETGGAGLIQRVGAASGDDHLLESPHGGMEFAVAESDPGIGELWCRGPSVMRGYWGDPATTARTTVGGWLHTGDVMRVGRNGSFRIAGRAGDAVEFPGGVVYSREVEVALLECPGVSEAAVVGVTTAGGPDLGVAVVRESGADVGLDTVREHVRAVLSGYRPSRRLCASVPMLPRTSTGRVDRRSVRSWLQGVHGSPGFCSTTKGYVDVG